MLALPYPLRVLIHHPLTRGRPVFALARVASWLVASRLLGGGYIIDFVGGTRLLVRRGMSGATGNLYFGLHDFQEMAFVIHFLRKGDLFADIGANIGSYSVLASGVSGARSFSYEPVASTVRHLEDNISLNRLGDLVTIRATALGSAPGVVRFTETLDCVNHVALEGDPAASFECSVVRLDDDIEGHAPDIIKVDVEGFETEVLAGAPRILASPRLKAVIIELNGQSSKYGHNDEDVREILRRNGFSRVIYDPIRRRLEALGSRRVPNNTVSDNEIWVRDFDVVLERLRGGPAVTVLGRAI
jgi:FkbM family methyltransferase